MPWWAEPTAEAASTGDVYAVETAFTGIMDVRAAEVKVYSALIAGPGE